MHNLSLPASGRLRLRDWPTVRLTPFRSPGVDASGNPSFGITIDATPEVTTISFVIDLPSQPLITTNGDVATLSFGASNMTVTASAAGSRSVFVVPGWRFGSELEIR